MPATEKTWRDQLQMHVIFAISALIMLAGTVWMLWRDHNNEWRKWQLDDRAVNHWTLEAQIAKAEAASGSQLQHLNRELATARSSTVDAALVKRFRDIVENQDKSLAAGEKRADFAAFDAAATELSNAQNGSPEAAKSRQRLLDAMDAFIREAKRREDALTTTKKFRAAKLTAEVSARGIAVGESKPTQEIDQRIAILSAEIAQLDADVANAKDYRLGLETVQKDIQYATLDLEKQITGLETDLKRLRENLANNPASAISSPGEWLNRGLILDALYTGNIKLDQIWLPDMKINYNFSSVSRYERCINCHRNIDRTAPGSATEPAYPAIPPDERIHVLQMNTPEKAPEVTKAEDSTEVQPTLATTYGLILAPIGQVDSDAVTVQVVFPESKAAVAGLQMGDVIKEINGGPIDSKDDVNHYLLELAAWGQPLTLKISRGLSQPFASHPRLDLFVGPSSPHKKGEMGCTICHDGQGSATEFKWASHTPNNPKQALAWSREHGWFDNHHWIFPMLPARFLESNCLKCHHEVVELEPSERFPQPPAPKLVSGYHLVRQYGCFGCHDINGFDGPKKRIGPDLRLEPNYSEVASQVLQDPGLNAQERALATTLVTGTDAGTVREQLIRSIRADAAAAMADPAAVPRLTKATYTLADALKEVEAPGSFRKVGPSLRHLNSKVDFSWLYDWIRRPADFRPSTRMPQFFGHFDHLNGDRPEFTIRDASGKEVQVTDQEYTKRFERIEILALSNFLLTNSQPFNYLDPTPGVEAASSERGKWQFESRGCLACHSHVEFPNIHSTQGPDLSRVAAKFNTDKGQRWLYSWLKSPNRYHARTVMPNLFLDPIVETDPDGKPTGRVTDPVADIVAYLMSVPANWQPEAPIPSGELSPEDAQALEDLTTVWLSASFPKRRAEAFAKDGIPYDLGTTVKVDEQVLVKEPTPAEVQAGASAKTLHKDGFLTTANRKQRQLEYVARRSLSRYGCFGCHDIPGYEDAKPVGTPLANWGRKDPAQLAFENIGQFLITHGVHGENAAHSAHADENAVAAAHGAPLANPTSAEVGEPEHSDDHAHLNPRDYDANTGFFLQSLIGHQRTGFLWQKLRAPRSFDFETTRNKRYDERLRMPKFPFSEEEREEVMTFILGLTSEAPAEKFIYKPDARQEAIVQGRHVLEKYNCAGCHVLDMERWKIAFEPNQFEAPPATSDFPFLAPDFKPEQLRASLTTDDRGLLHADLHGMTMLNEATGTPKFVDADGVPIEPDDKESPPFFEFALYQPALVNGEARLPGVQNLLIPANSDRNGPAKGTAFDGKGGDLAKYLFPRVIAEEMKTNPQAKGSEAWGWLPPPLHNEGGKVQTEWLHDFLMDPTAIRPAAVLRMPNFNMSSDDASKLVNYFAAKENADFPYEYMQRRRQGYLTGLEQDHPELLNDAMKIVTDGNYCVKCHSVGDFQVKGAVKTLGPNLDQVYSRLRPEFVQRWVGNPQRILPYTGMPVNIPFSPEPPTFGGVNQQLFPGTSKTQLDGLVDLLMNFDEYAKRKTSIKSLVKEPPPAPATTKSDDPPDDRSASVDAP